MHQKLKQQVHILDKHEYTSMKPGLERITALLQQLSLFPLPFQCIQVVGTNGKGTTSRYLHVLLRSLGYNAGL